MKHYRPKTHSKPQPLPAEVIEARAGLIPASDDWPVCRRCGSNLTDDDAPDDGTDPFNVFCVICKAELPPDPENMNGNRATWADRAIEAFCIQTGTEPEDALCHLIADLMHWADRRKDDSFEHELLRARDRYNQETTADHTKVIHGLCTVCGHYGDDCTGKAEETIP